MASLPIGSNKILEIQSGNIHVVIKSKTYHPTITYDVISEANSSIRVTGLDVNSVKIYGEEKIADNGDAVSASSQSFTVYPMFFEQTDYEIVIQGEKGDNLSFWHENHSVKERVGSVTDSNDLLTGVINFGNSAGYSDLEIYSDGRKQLSVRLEVFPSKISYKEDYQEMLADISNEIYGAVVDFMRNTYQEFALGKTNTSTPAMFFEIIQNIFDKFVNATNTIIRIPNHKLYVEHPIVPAHKVKKTDSKTVNWLLKHPENVVQKDGRYAAVKAPTVRKQITYNTIENQFTKFILKSTIKRLKEFKDRYEKSTKVTEDMVMTKVDYMVATLNKTINNSFLREVDDYQSTQSMSLVFEMAPGYRELYKYYLMLQRGLEVNGDVFRLSLKDTAQLYEYWCFIKLVCIMKKNYQLASSDVIKVDKSGVTITLVKGKESCVTFINPRTGERMVLSYNPKESHTQTVNQKPDNVLTLEKRGTDVEYKYVFDAKYRIENNPSDPYYPGETPGPKVDDINTMHRYRDSIVYESKTPSRFMFEKTMFGAYVLFPYNNEDEYSRHRFYKSIETVNIGGLPFLPGATRMVEDFIAELITDSRESAFERSSLPRGIEERLEKYDWPVRDVMVGTVRTKEQLDFNKDKKGYYVPAKYISDDDLPIRYIALHEENLGGESGIKVVGEVLTAQKLKRGKIPVSMSRNNADETYYYFTVRSWQPLDKTIAIKDSSKGKPRFTNKLLLDTCTESYQLFEITTEEEYRLMQELNNAFGEGVVGGEKVFKINDKFSITTLNGKFTIMNIAGQIIDEVPIENFQKRPRVTFGKIKEMVK